MRWRRLLDETADVYLGLGSNVGDRLAALRTAASAIGANPDVSVVAASGVYETEAHVLPGAPPQPDHLNAVLHVRTRLHPRAVLNIAQAVEWRAGRDHAAPRWGPRVLDVDLLLYGDDELRADGLTLPHPRLAGRRFVLAPLAELASHRVVPGLNRTIADLLAATPDTADVRRTDLDLLA